jgi:hypothetical protein
MASTSWKKQGNRFFTWAPWRKTVLPTPWFYLRKAHSWTLDLQKCKKTNLCNFEPLILHYLRNCTLFEDNHFLKTIYVKLFPQKLVYKVDFHEFFTFTNFVIISLRFLKLTCGCSSHLKGWVQQPSISARKESVGSH